MRNVRLFRALLSVDKKTVIEDIESVEDDDVAELVVAQVRPRSGRQVLFRAPTFHLSRF